VGERKENVLLARTGANLQPTPVPNPLRNAKGMTWMG
jgi:hypothetical protein